MVIVVAEGAGQELMAKQSLENKDPSGNTQLRDVGMWLSQKIKVFKLQYFLCIFEFKIYMHQNSPV